MTKEIKPTVEFSSDNLTAEESFWVMWYFLQKNYELSGGQFDITDILSASEPITISGTEIKVPADHGMTSFWNEAIKKFREQGIPPLKACMK